jgi:hypothetical protein
VKTLQRNTGKQCGKNFVENQYQQLARGFDKRMLEVTEGGYDIDVFWDHFPAVKREHVIKFLEASGREYLLSHYHESLA